MCQQFVLSVGWVVAGSSVCGVVVQLLLFHNRCACWVDMDDSVQWSVDMCCGCAVFYEVAVSVFAS